jgi:hypothetical protein
MTTFIGDGARRIARRMSPTTVVIRVVACGAVLLIAQLMTPATASACDVGIGYKPTLSFDFGTALSGGQCSNGTSLTAAAVLAVLAVAVLAGVLKVLFDRGATVATTLATAQGIAPEDTEPALIRYLESAGLDQPEPGSRPNPSPPGPASS